MTFFSQLNESHNDELLSEEPVLIFFNEKIWYLEFSERLKLLEEIIGHPSFIFITNLKSVCDFCCLDVIHK